ncbi:MAG: DNA-processing protein DprA [Nanoarchaeota archaeon]|nr:DNA-processing protein DprA [Nanoarchaeota archaeon]
MEFPIHTIPFSDANYPLLLKEISDPPNSLYYRGALPGVFPIVGIVGTRKASPEARSLARETAEILSRNGFGVASGLAFGVDAAAHEGAILGGTPTFAVLGNGLSGIYPREHENLAREILETGGGIFSEYEPDVPALPHRFLERNRIISGLSIAVVLIEVPLRSGALSTARHATIQGRDVLVFANRPSNHQYEGSHMLLREGARFVASPEEVLEDIVATLFRYPGLELRERLPKNSPSRRPLENETERQVYEKLFQASAPLTVDNLAEITTLEIQALNRILTGLLLSGIVMEEGGRFYIK